MTEHPSATGGRRTGASRAAARRPVAGVGQRASAGGRWAVTHPWPLLLLIGFVLFALWAIGTRNQPHQVRAVFSEAPGLYSGEDVQVNGIDVGKVTSLNYEGGNAVVGVGISDGSFWPLHQGTQVTLRYGTTVGNGTRFVQLDPGPSSAPAIPENGLITLADTHSATEFDQVFNIFDGPTRRSFSGALDSTGKVLAPRTSQIGAGVDASGPAFGNLAGFTGALAADRRALSGLVSSGNAVTAALASHEGEIQSLVSGAAGTFHAFGTNTGGISGSLDRLQPTLVQMRSTLARLDTSIGHLDGLVTDLAPGAAKLGPLSATLRPALSDLRTTIPVADRTFDTTTSAAPAITTLLRRVLPFSPPASSALTSLAPMVACIRPYSPEIAALLTTWTSFNAPVDGTSHLGRLLPMLGPTAFTSSPESPATFMKLFGPTGATYALVRPPGYNAGQPQFIPACDYTQSYLNPAADPEVGK